MKYNKTNFEKYLKHNKTLANTTINTYSSISFKFINSKLTIDEYINKNELTIYQLKMFKYAITHLNTYLKLNYLSTYNISHLELPKFYPKSPIYLIEKEIKLLLKSKICNKSIFNIRNECIVRLFIETGIRVSELISLQYEDIYQNHIIVKGKGRKERTVIITSVLRNNLLSLRKHNTHLFINKWQNPLSRKGIYNIIKNLGIKSGIEKRVSPHVLRHTHATLMLNNGMDIYSLSKLLGHSSISTTQIYLHFNKNVKHIHSKIMRLVI